MEYPRSASSKSQSLVQLGSRLGESEAAQTTGNQCISTIGPTNPVSRPKTHGPEIEKEIRERVSANARLESQ